MEKASQKQEKVLDFASTVPREEVRRTFKWNDSSKARQ